jgi:hypothetical protein
MWRETPREGFQSRETLDVLSVLRAVPGIAYLQKNGCMDNRRAVARFLLVSRASWVATSGFRIGFLFPVADGIDRSALSSNSSASRAL